MLGRSTPDLLIRFTDDDIGPETAPPGRDGSTTTLSANEAFRRLLGRDRPMSRFRRLGLLGRPPAEGIGYSIAPMVALLAQPESVTTFDARSGRARTESSARFVATSLFPALGQIVASGGALAAQHVLARSVGRVRHREPRHPGGRLRRVLYVRPLVGIPASVGGSVSHTHGVIRALRDSGVEVDAITNDASIRLTAASDPDPPCTWRVVDVANALKALPASAAFGTDLALVGAGLRAAGAADVIYQRHARFSLAGPMLARLTGTPVFLEYNGSEAFFNDAYHASPLGRQLVLCEDMALASADRIFVTSEVDRRNLLARGLDPDRLVVTPNGVDPARFPMSGGGEIRRMLGLADADLVVGFVGSFGPWHGASRLASAFVEVAEAEPRMRLLLVGDGPERPGVLAGLAAADVLDRVVFTGKIAPSEVPAHLDACDILASPHVPLPGDIEFFGSPTKLFEYMAAGKAIVASRLGQIADVLDHERTALLVEPGAVDELADAIQRLATLPALRDELGAAARRTVVDRHTWTRNATRIDAAYRELA